jgi:hypothetical protein
MLAQVASVATIPMTYQHGDGQRVHSQQAAQRELGLRPDPDAERHAAPEHCRRREDDERRGAPAPTEKESGDGRADRRENRGEQ